MRRQIVRKISPLCSLFFFFILCIGSISQGYSYSPNAKQQPQPACTKVPHTLELKNGYFFFSDSKMRKIYHRGGWDVQLASSSTVWQWLQVYVSAGFIEKRGRSLFDREKTSIWMVPVSVGLKPVVVIRPWVEWYFAVGPRYVYVHQHNHSPYVDTHIHQSGLGGFVNTGFNFIFWRHFLVDPFGEYFYAKMRFHAKKPGVQGRSEQVSGFTFGVGLGYAF